MTSSMNSIITQTTYNQFFVRQTSFQESKATLYNYSSSYDQTAFKDQEFYNGY